MSVAVQGGHRRITNADPRFGFGKLFDPKINRSLRDGMAADLLSDHFTEDNMPAAWLPAIYETRRRGCLAIDLRALPEPMATEFVWCLQRHADLGLTFMAREVNRLAKSIAMVIQDREDIVSLLDLGRDEWVEEIHGARMRAGWPQRGMKPTPHNEGCLARFMSMLVYPYHRGQWWQLNIWNPFLDQRIPQRHHEPSGRAKIHFTQLTTEWLREGAKFWMGRQLERDQCTWGTMRSRQHSLLHFQRYLDIVGSDGPRLAGPDELGSWAQDFRTWLRHQKVVAGARKGQPLGAAPRRSAMTAVEQLYRFMFQERAAARRALGRNAWTGLTPQHTVLFNFGDKPTGPKAPKPEMVLSDALLSRIVEGCQILERPVSDGGFGDPQLARILKLLVKTGRRVNEVTMLDFDPLIAIPFPDPKGHVARMRYQQTKISTGDATILVDEEIVDLVREQQSFAKELIARLGGPPADPKYLFLSQISNRNGDRPYSAGTGRKRLNDLGELLDLRDEAGRKVFLSRTHMFRHTKATSLLNAGVPIHVGMRYMGHQSPVMFMHYAQTLAETQEAEFLRYRKLTSDGRDYQRDPREMFEALALSDRTDRILPNGYCTLPPRQACDKGNACLSCTKFVTDQTFEPALRHQLAATEQLITDRQEAHAGRYGEPMGPENIWLKGRTTETTALKQILHMIDTIRTSDGTFTPLRGAGTPQQPKASP